jgi:hypothetical protein
LQSGALIEPNRHELRRDFVVSFEKRRPDPVAYFNLSAQCIAIRSDFLGCCGTKVGFER